MQVKLTRFLPDLSLDFLPHTGPEEVYRNPSYRDEHDKGGRIDA
jgi:hypothetical protein